LSRFTAEADDHQRARFNILRRPSPRIAAAYEEYHSERGEITDHEFECFGAEAEFIFGSDIVAHLKNFGQCQQLDLAWFSNPFKKYLQLS
jgi:hypothetical protein